MEDTCTMTCKTCGHVGLADGSDGYYYCLQCGSQADDIMDTGVADEDFVDKGGDARGALYQPIHTRQRYQPLTPSQPLSQHDLRHSQFWSQLTPQQANATDNRDQHLWVKKEEEEQQYDAVGPVGPTDFGSEKNAEAGLSYEDYYNEVRSRYVMGVQLMVQYQCEALVEKFKVTPLICGIVGSLWLRFVASSGVFRDAWADEAVQDSEIQTPGEVGDTNHRIRHKAEPHNLHGRRAVMIWVQALRKSISLSCSLAISFLACHIAREAILPTDFVQWSLEGKIPYFAAFVDIGRQMGERSRACPVSASVMFKPSQVVSSQKLESLAASIAETIGLHLPPVNFYEIASRYLKQLSLPVDKILPCACHIYEWSMPPELYLSTNEFRLPTRVCALSILIVAIRIIYNIHGFGSWEKSVSSHNVSPSMSDHEERLGPVYGSNLKDDDKQDDVKEGLSSPRTVDELETKSFRNSSPVLKSEFDAEELLKGLEAKYSCVSDPYEYSRNLPTYLQFCKDVVFAGVEPSSLDNEYKTVEELWDFFQSEKDFKRPEVQYKSALSQKISNDDNVSLCRFSMQSEKLKDTSYGTSPSNDDGNFNGLDNVDGDCASASSQGDGTTEPRTKMGAESPKDRAIRRMKLDMEENRFCYIPPRVNLKRFDYLHYARKKDEGALTYIAHADYYILLRACARVAQLDIRIMHVGVLNFERRLAWLENRIDHCLQIDPPKLNCQSCVDLPKESEDVTDDPIGLSDLSL